MNNSKTFRLFISSTFNDFRREREILQIEVFPKIKAYARRRGYIFQPIDLRWGINEEAQLNQKTFDLCLEEVRRCKHYPHPNFLVMLGDRYGWIPLPYAIEKHEFEAIRDNVKEHEEMLNIVYEPYRIYHDPDNRGDYVTKQKECKRISKTTLLEQWYTLDENHIPASYILNERDEASDYKVYENWEAEESALREIFQSSVERLGFDEKRERKYVMSATEAEIEEGILPYIGLTEEQQKLFKSNEVLQKVDTKYIFAFLRHIKEQTVTPNIFCDIERGQAHILKKSLKGVLPEENVLEKTVEVIDETTLEESYLAILEEIVYDFLKAKIDEQVEQEDNVGELDLEKEVQTHFAQVKREDFLGQEKSLKRIEMYIGSADTRPFVLYGASGKGKSALMAQAIYYATQKYSEKKVLYRFVGATPHASTMKEILISLFSELGKDMRVEDEEYHADILDNDGKETFQQFSKRFHDSWQKIERETVVFIDAVDQLTHDDTFLWLPSTLPENVKIIISVLKDPKYANLDSYFNALEKKTDLFHEILDFDKPLDLLETLLKKEKRCLHEHQKNYFLKLYESVKSPLYVTVAGQEMKLWKSYDGVEGKKNLVNSGKMQKLAPTQEGIIEEFIGNLSMLYHHDKEFVERVLVYLLASKDGLSESELLALIAIDEIFVKRMAPDTWHENKTKEFPIVIWSRLYAQLAPFLSLKSQDREELMYFFHREFEETVLHLVDTQEIYKKYLLLLLQYIKKHEQSVHMYRRMSSLYLSSIIGYEERYKNKKDVNDIILKLIERMSMEYLVYLLSYMHKMVLLSKSELDMPTYQYRVKHYYEISKALYDINPEIWRLDYLRSLNLLSYFLKVTAMSGLSELKEALLIVDPYKNDRTYIIMYIETVINIVDHYNFVSHLSREAMLKLSEALDVYIKHNELFTNDEQEKKIFYRLLHKMTTTSLIEYDQTRNSFFLEKALETGSIAFQDEDSVNLPNEELSLIWNDMGEVYNRKALISDKEKNLKLALHAYEESLKNIFPEYKKNSIKYRDNYVNKLKNIADVYLKLKQYAAAVSRLHEAEKICFDSYKKNPKLIASLYSTVLNNLGDTYSSAGCFTLAIRILEKALHIAKEYNLSDIHIVTENLILAKTMQESSLVQCQISIERNGECLCGSGKKYKKCCM